jgi:hypothetical protein
VHLGHGQTEQPLWGRGVVKEMVPGVGNGSILGATTRWLLIKEMNGLVRDLQISASVVDVERVVPDAKQCR